MAIPKINGYRFSWSSITLDLGDGGLIQDFTEISYSTTSERSKYYGTGRKPRGRTAKVLDFEGSMTVSKEVFAEIIAKLDPDLSGFGDKTFTVTVAYEDKNNNIVVDILEGVEIDGVEESYSQGTDALSVNLTLSIMNINYDGHDMFAGPS